MCALTLRALGKQVFHVILQLLDELMMAFKELTPRQWVTGKTFALNERLNALAFYR